MKNTTAAKHATAKKILTCPHSIFPLYEISEAGCLKQIAARLIGARLVGNIWTDSKAAWVKIDPKLVNFPKQAVDRTPLFDAWTRLNQE
jgi:hypothetical protein